MAQSVMGHRLYQVKVVILLWLEAVQKALDDPQNLLPMKLQIVLGRRFSLRTGPRLLPRCQPEIRRGCR